jgi:hypothetical protein
MCTRCGYNLTGQAVLREPYYSMLMVRCPECGTAAAVQEYPLLGRWANRWAAVLAALWLFVMLALLFGGSAAMYGASMWAVEMGSRNYTNSIGDHWQRWAAQSTQQSQSTTAPFIRYSTNDFDKWLKTVGASTLLQDAGGRWGAIDWTRLYFGMPWLILPFVLGCTWAVALPGRTRAGLIVWGFIVMLVSIGYCSLYIFSLYSQSASYNSGYWSGYQFASNQLGPTLIGVSQAAQGVVLLIAILMGRPLARRMINIMLPPRLRSSLAFLWLCDGLAPPGNAPAKNASRRSHDL